MIEALQRKLLIDTDFADYLRAVAPPPAVPSNWKPGLFSSDKPWGTLEDAVALLSGGKTAEGRELLRRLSKHTGDPTAKAVLAKELTRPPEDGKLSWSYLAQLPEDSCEYNSIRASRSLSGRDYDAGGEFFLKADATRPASIYGCAFFFEAFLYSSDLYFQTRLLMPRKRTMESVIVASPLKGAAQLSLHMRQEAWTTFKMGWIQADERANNYAKTLNVEMTADERKLIEETMSMMCAAGMGLVLFDLRLRRDAREVFAELASALEGTPKYCAQVLARG